MRRRREGQVVLPRIARAVQSHAMQTLQQLANVLDTDGREQQRVHDAGAEFDDRGMVLEQPGQRRSNAFVLLAGQLIGSICHRFAMYSHLR